MNVLQWPSVRAQRAETETFGGRPDRVRSLVSALPREHVSTLRLLWCELGSVGGLSSNMGPQLDRLAAQPRRFRAKEHAPVPRSAAERLADRARAEESRWARDLPAHVVESLEPDPVPPPEPSSVRLALASGWTTRSPRRLRGAVVARGYRPPVIFCSPSHSTRVDTSEMDGWACWGNERRAASVDRAYRTLLRMVDRGEGRDVSILFRMYGDAPPTHDALEFAPIGEYAPIAQDAPKVVARARAMTLSARRQPGAESVTVTTLAALRSLLSTTGRDATVSAIRVECFRLVRQASMRFCEAWDGVGPRELARQARGPWEKARDDD